MSYLTPGRRIGNALYKMAFPVYRPLYSVFKAYADRAERQLLAERIAEGAIVVDAGANIGTLSRFLAKVVGPKGVVHSFEPAPDNFRRLAAEVAGLTNVRVNEMAVSDKTESKLLYISEDLNVDHRAYPTEGEVRQTISIEATTLDDYFPPGSRVDLLKADIQGYELHALRGATRVLSDNQQIILLLEFWPFGLRKAGSSAGEMLSFLRERNFEIFSLDKNGVTKFEYNEKIEPDSGVYYNLFAQRKQSPV